MPLSQLKGGLKVVVHPVSWVAVVTPTDRPKSVRNRCVIELFCGVVYVVTLPVWYFCWCRGFCHRTESDLFLFLLTANYVIRMFVVSSQHLQSSASDKMTCSCFCHVRLVLSKAFYTVDEYIEIKSRDILWVISILLFNITYTTWTLITYRKNIQFCIRKTFTADSLSGCREQRWPSG